MEPLSQEFIDSCRRENGRIIRGDSMTRIETFVDAAFAFAFTMLVISIDEIPTSPPELFELSKDIPAFVMSALSIGAVWLSHSSWSRTFGLQDRLTVNLSLGLVILMLVFVYPIKLMMQSTVIFISANLLGFTTFDTGLFENQGWEDGAVAGLFIYVAIGLVALGLIIVAFYQNALRYARELRMTQFERRYCYEMTIAWSMVVLTALLSLLIALLADIDRVSLSGFIYLTLVASIPAAQYVHSKVSKASAQLDKVESADSNTD